MSVAAFSFLVTNGQESATAAHATDGIVYLNTHSKETSMGFASTAGLRAEVLAGCRVLHHFRIVEGFGHISARLSGGKILITPRRPLGLVSEAELVELDMDGR